MKKTILILVLMIFIPKAFGLSCVVETGNGRYQCTSAGESGKCPGANFVSNEDC